MREACFNRIRRDMPRTEGKQANTKYTRIGTKSYTEVERGHTVQEKNILLLKGRQRCWSETLAEYPESPNTKKEQGLFHK